MLSAFFKQISLCIWHSEHNRVICYHYFHYFPVWWSWPASEYIYLRKYWKKNLEVRAMLFWFQKQSFNGQFPRNFQCTNYIHIRHLLVIKKSFEWTVKFCQTAKYSVNAAWHYDIMLNIGVSLCSNRIPWQPKTVKLLHHWTLTWILEVHFRSLIMTAASFFMYKITYHSFLLVNWWFILSQTRRWRSTPTYLASQNNYREWYTVFFPSYSIHVKCKLHEYFRWVHGYATELILSLFW
jgi:hypothetical protein